MVHSVASYYNQNYSYQVHGSRSNASSVFQIDSGMELEGSSNSIVQNQNILEGLSDETKENLIGAYQGLDWNDEESITAFLQKGVELGYFDQNDIDQSFLCVEDPNLLNGVQYIDENPVNFIKSSMEFEKLQLKMAIDFYNQVPGSPQIAALEKHLSSLTKVWDFINGVSGLTEKK